jgi:hypothetical protein
MTDGRAARRTGHARLGSVTRYAMIAGILGLVLVAIGVTIEPRRALAAYVFGYATVFTIVVGALIQVMLSHVTGARWFTVLRRLTLDVTGAIPVLALLAIPLLAGVRVLYPWADPAALPADARALIARKAAWLNVPFFIARSVLYLVAWIVVAWALRRSAHAQDHALGDRAVRAARRLRRLSAIGLVVVALTLTFAAFDWLMSLEPTWYSTIYGVYVFAGGYLAALALVAVVGYVASRGTTAMGGAVTSEHFGALGQLLLTFVIFWAYIACAQYLIIWIGDIPREVSWYAVRTSGSWAVLALIVGIGQFVIPLVLLLPRGLKRRPAFLAALAGWLLAMHLLELYWMVLPAIDPAGVNLSWVDVAALLMIGGFALAAACWRARGDPALPLGDPYLAGALRYVEP